MDKKTLPPTVYYVDLNGDGLFEIAELEEGNKPQPIQGKEQFVTDFYRALKYPASAREKGIEGIVVLEIDVDTKGKVVNVGTKRGISQDCDIAAKNALISATLMGYSPLMINNIPNKFKMDVAVGFWLGR